jgi:ABC-type Zn2+ transport system substrate-binding protein/surface adhesin
MFPEGQWSSLFGLFVGDDEKSFKILILEIAERIFWWSAGAEPLLDRHPATASRTSRRGQSLTIDIYFKGAATLTVMATLHTQTQTHKQTNTHTHTYSHTHTHTHTNTHTTHKHTQKHRHTQSFTTEQCALDAYSGKKLSWAPIDF